jgi:hypothetical protein
VEIVLVLQSNLPRDVELDSISVTLMPFQKFISSIEENISLNDDEASRVLEVESPKVSRGVNEIKITWTPMAPGQHVVYKTTIFWKGVEFVYESTKVQRAPIRIDVVPSEATQSITVQPKFLIPGHKQPVAITFKAGTDIIQKGTLQLVCSSGLLLIPPGADESEKKWTPSCSIPLPPCPPGESRLLTAIVKSEKPEEESDIMQTLHVHVTTDYTFSPHGTGRKVILDNALSNHVMEAVIPTLGQAAITVEEVNMLKYSHEKFLLRISMMCHTPVPFTFKSWSLSLPSSLKLDENGDMNKFLIDTGILSEEKVSLGFNCIRVPTPAHTSSHDGKLTVNFVDEFGTSFEEVLRFKTPIIEIPRVEISSVTSLPVALSIAQESGPVNVPVNFEYSVDTSSLKENADPMIYSINLNHPDWILSGPVRGKIETPNTTVQVVAIPTRPGILETFPLLTLAVCDNKGKASVVLTTYFAQSPSYYAAASQSATSIACASLKSIKQ